MKFNRLLPFAFIASSVLALSACTTPATNGDEEGGGVNGGSSTQTAGMGQNGQFNGQQGNSNRRIYYFAYDNSVLSPQDRSIVVGYANYLSAHPNKKALVEGHTDPRGSREYNVGLGERRANAVAEVLKAQGVEEDRIREVSYGAQRLASRGHSESDYQADRRAVLVIE